MQYDQPLDTLEVYEGLNFAREALTRLGRQNGKRTSPGRTCRDIKEQNPDFKNGQYWIDPNEGSARDAILVYCQMEEGETCLLPSPTVYENQRWTKDTRRGQYFMDDINGHKEFTYKVDRGQLKFLQMHSQTATQTITYHCRNSEAYGTRLSALTGDELDTAEGRFKKTTFVNVRDSCVMDNEWHNATYNVHTQKTDLLPITDMLIFDVGRPDQEFGVELGNVCFS